MAVFHAALAERSARPAGRQLQRGAPRLALLLALALQAPAHGSRPPVPAEAIEPYPAAEVAEFLRRVSQSFRRARGLRRPRALGLLEAPQGGALEIGMVATPQISGYAEASVGNWQEYAALHGYGIRVGRGLAEACGAELAQRLEAAAGRKLAPIWAKICMLRNLLAEGPRGPAPGYVLVVDADTFVQQPEFDVLGALARGSLEKSPNASCLMFDDRMSRDDYPNCWGWGKGDGKGHCMPNTFFMLARKGPEAQAFVQRWLDQAVQQCASDAKQSPTTQRVLWHCTLPETEQLRPGFLLVENGMDTVYTLSLRHEASPLVHFQSYKKDLAGVRKAIGRVVFRGAAGQEGGAQRLASAALQRPRE